MSLNFNIHGINTTEGGGGGEVKNQNKTITENGVYTADSGYTGLGRVSVNVETTEPTLASLTVIPSTTAQTITPPSGTDGYNTVSVNAVTASIDSDIVAENIKKDVEILGVTGTYEGITPSGTITITSNGTTDVTNYASAEVNVSGGGGSQVVRGSWVVPQCVLDLEEAFDNYDEVAYSDAPFVYGILLHKGIGEIYVISRQGSKFITSDGISDVFSEGANTVTFNNPDADNWIVFISNIDVSISIPIRPYNSALTASKATYRYLIAKNTQNDTTVFNDLLDKCAGLESFKLINIKAGSNFTGSDCKGAMRKYIPPITNWSNSTPASDFTSYFSSDGYTLPNLPYGLNLSGVTTALYLSGSSQKMREAYITLPNANFTLSDKGVTFTKDNWQYIAQHAPTVSNKTLSMGAINIAICGGATGTIISTLTSKGWTVN